MDEKVRELFEVKRKQRVIDAQMPFMDKIYRVVELQKMAKAILNSRGKDITVWQLPKRCGDYVVWGKNGPEKQ